MHKLGPDPVPGACTRQRRDAHTHLRPGRALYVPVQVAAGRQAWTAAEAHHLPAADPAAASATGQLGRPPAAASTGTAAGLRSGEAAGQTRTALHGHAEVSPLPPPCGALLMRIGSASLGCAVHQSLACSQQAECEQCLPRWMTCSVARGGGGGDLQRPASHLLRTTGSPSARQAWQDTSGSGGWSKFPPIGGRGGGAGGGAGAGAGAAGARVSSSSPRAMSPGRALQEVKQKLNNYMTGRSNASG